MRRTTRDTFGVARHLNYHLNHVLKEFNLTMIQFIFLKIVEDKENVTVSQIAELMRNDRPTISAIFNRLYDKKIVTKRDNKKDRRSFYVKLAKDKKDLLDKADKALKKEEIRFFSVLDKEEVLAFQNCIEKLNPRKSNKKEDEKKYEEHKKTK